MRRVSLFSALLLLAPVSVFGQAAPNLAEFQTALDRANAATVTSDIGGTLPGYGGDAAGLQSRAGDSVLSLQSDGANARTSNPMSGSLTNTFNWRTANPVDANATWVKSALQIANDPQPQTGGAEGTTSTFCRSSNGSTGSTTLYSCESGNQVVTKDENCETYRDVVRVPNERVCHTDSYFEPYATYENSGAYTEAHSCLIFAGPAGLNYSQGCGILIGKIDAGECAPPKLVKSNQYIQYCKSAFVGKPDVTYLGHRYDSCAPVRAEGACSLQSSACIRWIDETAGVCGDREMTYRCGAGGYEDRGENVAACTAFASSPACAEVSRQCLSTAAEQPDLMVALGLAPETCLQTRIGFTCDAVAGTGSDCEAPAGCVLKSTSCIDPDADATHPCQTYDHTYQCPAAQTSENAGQATCDASWVNGTGFITASDDPQNDLPQALSAINALKEASGSYRDSGTLTIFGGEPLKCGKSIGGLSNCCKDSGVLNDVGLTSCNADEKKLAARQAKKACHYVGTYCSNKSFFGCLQKKMSYCCYGSVLARIVEEAGHDQLGKSWGDAKTPKCGGFTIEEFQSIDLTNVDFSDLYADKLGQLAENDPNSTVAAITASINSMNADQRATK